jgi:benzoylformate decarboxylase
LARLAARLLEADSPLILAGHEASTSGALEELARVASLLGAPVYLQTVPHSAVFPSRHPLFMGELTRDQRRMRATLEGADLLFAAGSDVFTVSVPSAVDPLPPGLPVVQLGLRDWELGKNYPAEIALRADLRETLAALAPELEARRTPAQAAAAGRRAEAIRPRNWSANRERRLAELERLRAVKPIDPEYLMACVARALPADGVVVDEGITTSRALLQHLDIADPKRYFGLCGGGIGWGLPGAVGVKLGLPERPLLCISGDGSALYNVQALWSAAHEKLPIAFVICNNGSYRILKERLFAYGGEAVARETFIGMDLDHPPIDFVALAESLGVAARRVTEPAEVPGALEEALAAEAPRLLDVHVARGFKP